MRRCGGVGNGDGMHEQNHRKQDKQMPTWVVSQWSGMKLKDMLSMLNYHAQCHALGKEATYLRSHLRSIKLASARPPGGFWENYWRTSCVNIWRSLL